MKQGEKCSISRVVGTQWSPLEITGKDVSYCVKVRIHLILEVEGAVENVQKVKSHSDTYDRVYSVL